MPFLPLLTGLLLLAAHAALAQFDGATHNGTITITNYSGPGGAVSIPNTLNGMPVTGIGTAAFFDYENVTSVVIPGSVTSIGTAAFSDCYGLTNVIMSNGVASIGDDAFHYCISLTSATIPGSVTNIGMSAFEHCTSLAAIAIPDSVAVIEDYAFSDCTSLASVTIPSRVASIGNDAFWGCAGLTNVNIANGVTSIGDYAFAGCVNLAGVTVPGSVSGLGDYAFASCAGLTALYFQGNAPGADMTVFAGDGATGYYLAGTTGWSTPFYGLTAVELNGIAFTANPTSGTAPLTASFTSSNVDSAGNAISQWNWTFGDGSTSTAQNPSHTYTNAGTFHPALFATNVIGATVPGSNSVSITAIGVAPQPGIAGSGVSGTNLMVNGSDGLLAGTYHVLTSTNLALPLTQWMTVATNILQVGGKFSITITNTISRAVPQQFYILQSP